ncbi:MAG: hypothetical protein NUW21_01980 [Elusimicrobia bacterium]|nr:hypothetical protein [Elusimicrobiota bacterium]
MIKFKSLSRRRIAGLGLAAVLASAAGIVHAQTEAGTMPETETAASVETRSSESVIKNWPKKVQADARMLIDRYGEPSSVEDDRLVWTDNGPWKRTVMHKEGLTRSMIGRSRDHLEQVISREVPEEKVAELEKFDKRIKVDRDAGELSSRSDSERMNFLTLNLADDIIKGQRTVSDARSFAKQVKSLEKAGKSSPYLDGLIFTMQNGAAEESGMTPEAGTAPETDMTPNTRQDMEQEAGEVEPSR